MDRHPNLTQARITLAAELMIKQKTVREIAAIIGCSVSTAHKYCEKAKQEWREKREEVLEEVFAEQLARLRAAEGYIWHKVEEGYAPAVERWLGIMDMRNRLLGLYAPTKNELEVGEALGEILSRISEEPEPERPALPAPKISIEGEVRELDPDPSIPE